MTRLITSVCTADHYQWYAPLFCYSVKRIDPTIKIKIFVLGDLDPDNKKLLDSIPGNDTEFVERYCTNYPRGVSTTNALRFTIPTDYLSGYNYIMITDIDFILFPTTPSLFDWHINNAKLNNWSFFGHHGPWKKNCPFEHGWTGEHERIAGGFFMVTPEWLKHTEEARKKHAGYLKEGTEGLYREEDEIILCKIHKESSFMIPQNKYFPTDLRGIHLGDFKFEHRWTNMAKMLNKISNNTCVKYRSLQKENGWQSIINKIKEPTVLKYMDNLKTYLDNRKI